MPILGEMRRQSQPEDSLILLVMVISVRCLVIIGFPILAGSNNFLFILKFKLVSCWIIILETFLLLLLFFYDEIKTRLLLEKQSLEVYSSLLSVLTVRDV